eukprot:c20666_g1_i3 orf=203-2080(+)
MEKLITAEEVLGALVESLVNPVLAKLRPFVGIKVAEQNLSNQMEAVAWLYNRYLCQELPNLVPLDWEDLCNRVSAQQTRLSKLMGASKPAVSCSLTFTEQKVKNACEAAKALKAPENSMKSVFVTKVCVCLLNFRKDKCVLALGATTTGIWSFIEKNKHAHCSENGSGGEPHLVLSDEELTFKAVQEQTGIMSSVLQIEDSFLIHDDLCQAGGSTKFYIMSCTGTFDLSPVIKLEKVAWVSLDIVFSKARDPLIDMLDSNVRGTPAVQYFPLRPFCSSLERWLTRQDEGKREEQPKHVVEKDHNDQNRTEPITPSIGGSNDDKSVFVQEEGEVKLRQLKMKVSAMDMSTELFVPTGSPQSSTGMKNMTKVRDGGSIDGISASVKEQEEDNARQGNQMINPVALDMKIAAPSCSPQSSTRIKKRAEERNIDKAGALLSLKTAFHSVRKKRKALSKDLREYTTQIDLLYKQIAECDADLAILLAGGKSGLQRAIQLCKTDCEKQTSSSDVSIDDSQGDALLKCSRAVINSQAETSNKKRPFQMLKSSMQELNEVCTRNEWPLPSYGVLTYKNKQRHNVYTGKVKIRSDDFELSETGEASDTSKAAKLSAAAYMLSTLHGLRARNHMF